MKVWLDDNRPAPPGWVWAFTPEQAIGLLRHGRMSDPSLDHDLDLERGEQEMTSYIVLLWRAPGRQRTLAPPAAGDCGIRTDGRFAGC